MTLPPVGAARARELVSRFPGLHVLVVGDVMLDRFIVGRVTRISPEAPVPVVRFSSEHCRLGGAANVAHNLAALGGRPSLMGVVGRDDAAARLRRELAAAGVADEGLVEDASRPTIEKVRIVTDRNQQVARVDYEDDRDTGADVARRVSERAVALGANAKVLLVSDYLKGTITATVMQSLVAMKASGAPLLVDPKIPHLKAYAGATLVTAEFRSLARIDAALITRGEHGMSLSSREAEGAIPAIAREVSDVTGAGDTVVATLANHTASGRDDGRSRCPQAEPRTRDRRGQVAKARDRRCDELFFSQKTSVHVLRSLNFRVFAFTGFFLVTSDF